jgi:hypothetical protein
MNIVVPPAWITVLDEYVGHVAVVDLSDDLIREESWPGIRITPTTVEHCGQAFYRYPGTVESVTARKRARLGIWEVCRNKSTLASEASGEERKFSGTIQLCREYDRTRLVMFVLTKEEP